MSQLFSPLAMSLGRPMRNRLALGPMTTSHSPADGQVSDDEISWLVGRAEGGFGMTLTCAAPVQPSGRGVPNQLSIYSDSFIEGLSRLAAGLRRSGSLGLVQLIHTGPRAPRETVPQPVSASALGGARALTPDEIQELVQDFIAAAIRAEKAGFDGVEIHGAHGYVLAAFLSSEQNQRTDSYGGSLENRSRLLFEVVSGIRAACGPSFQLGLRLSVERYGLRTLEIRDLADELFARGEIDFLHLSLWDVTKYSENSDARRQPLLELFAELTRGNVRLGVAGKVRTPADAESALERGADFAIIGRTAVLHRDYGQLARDLKWEPEAFPVTTDYLASQGISPQFAHLLKTNWDNLVV